MVEVKTFAEVYGSGSGWVVLENGRVRESRFGNPIIWTNLRAAEREARIVRERLARS